MSVRNPAQGGSNATGKSKARIISGMAGPTGQPKSSRSDFLLPPLPHHLFLCSSCWPHSQVDSKWRLLVARIISFTSAVERVSFLLVVIAELPGWILLDTCNCHSSCFLRQSLARGMECADWPNSGPWLFHICYMNKYERLKTAI